MIALTLSLTSAEGDTVGSLQLPGAGVTVSDSLDSTTTKATTDRINRLIDHVRAELLREQFHTTLPLYEFEQRVAEGLLAAGRHDSPDGQVIITLPVISLSSAQSASAQPPSLAEPANSAWDDLFQIMVPHPELPLGPHPENADADQFGDTTNQSEGESE